MLVFTSPPDNFNSTMNSVGIFCVYQNTVLHLHRQDHKPEGNKWSGPGGKLDPGETPKQALIGELYEETWIVVNDLEFIKTYYVKYPDRDFIYHKYRYVFNEKPIISLRETEHKWFDWFTPQEALEHSLLLWEDEVIRDIYWIE